MKCPPLPCVEGCECHGDFILSGTSCVPLSQCGCTDSKGFYHTVRGQSCLSWFHKAAGGVAQKELGTGGKQRQRVSQGWRALPHLQLPHF